MPSPIDQLLAIEEIKKLKARYFRFIDTRDWAGFRTLFVDDAWVDWRGALEENPDGTGEELLHGADAITEWTRSSVTDNRITTVHHGHMPEIDILTDDTARGIWALADILRTESGEPFRFFYGYGHYHEDYRKVDGQWRIASHRFTRLMVNTLLD